MSFNDYIYWQTLQETGKTPEEIYEYEHPKVVRCKDCKYWHDHITTTWCSRGAELRPQESGWIKRNPDDYCSYGESKEHE